MTPDLRTRMLDAAEELLDASPDRDISTRAVCNLVGVGQPVLYRLFGDKNGLLEAVVDHGFDRYLAVKRAAEASADPVVDLRNGWDTHIAFARAHPAVYRLMYSPAFTAVPSAATEALRILTDVLDRCAAAGKLHIPPSEAAQAIMSATIGVALSVISQPQTYCDPQLSYRVRDALFASLLDEGGTFAAANDFAGPAVQLTALLKTNSGPLSPAESALMLDWLNTLAEHEVQRS